MHQVVVDIDRPAPDLVERFRRAWMEAVVQAVAGKGCLIDPAIKPLGGRDWRIVGPAVTVLPDGTDTLMGLAATAIARPGDVIVVAAGGDCRASVWGNGLTTTARHRRLAGAVVDGTVLDSSAILRGDTPVFARGANMNHAVGCRPGSVNVDVVFGGVAVSPGDLVMGDLDGLLVIPRAALADAIAFAEEKSARLDANKARLGPDTTLFDLRGGRPMLERLGVRWTTRDDAERG